MNLSLNILSLEPEICESKLLKVKVTCSVKKKKSGQNIKVHCTQYHWAEGHREGPIYGD